jgi:hypothetical protein
VPENTRVSEVRMGFQHWTPIDQGQVGLCSTNSEVRMATVDPDGDVFEEVSFGGRTGSIAFSVARTGGSTCGSQQVQMQTPGMRVPAGEWSLVFEGQGYIVGTVTFAS